MLYRITSNGLIVLIECAREAKTFSARKHHSLLVFGLFIYLVDLIRMFAQLTQYANVKDASRIG